MENVIFLSVLPHFARFYRNRTGGKRLQFSQARKSSTVHRKKITVYPGLSTGLVNLRRMTWR